MIGDGRIFCVCNILLMMAFLSGVWGHGRLIDPPSRSSMWRYGFNTLPNYNDHELFCGGIDVQWKKNGGRCGVCGDPYDQPQPRDNEAGGKYGLGIIVKRYKPGQVITCTVDITANHKGYFEFKICPNNNPKRIVSESCLDKHILLLAYSGGTRYYVKDGYIGLVNVQLKLPEGLTCSQCVFRWEYKGGNNWGTCQNGSQCLGCGPQETFRACADVSVGNVDDDDYERTNGADKDHDEERNDSSRNLDDSKEESLIPDSQSHSMNNCKAVESMKVIPGLDEWCHTNCALGYCPSATCTC